MIPDPLSQPHIPDPSSRTRNKPGPETTPDSKESILAKESADFSARIAVLGPKWRYMNVFRNPRTKKRYFVCEDYTRYGSPIVRLHVTDQIGDDENRSDQG